MLQDYEGRFPAALLLVTPCSLVPYSLFLPV